MNPNLWDWLYRQSMRSTDYRMRGLNRSGIKGRYYSMTLGRLKPSQSDLWVMRMIGEYNKQYPLGALPDNYPRGRKFMSVQDIQGFFAPRVINPCSAPKAVETVPTKTAIERAEASLAELKAKAKEEAKVTREAERAAAEKAEALQFKKALEERLTYESGLAGATQALIAAIIQIELCGGRAQMSEPFAEFRTELSPLAESYGFRIVLVGNKDVAVLTR